MELSARIILPFGDDTSSAEDIELFLAPFAHVQVTKAAQNPTKSWDHTLRIFLRSAGLWAAKRSKLDPLADRAPEWLQSVRAFWDKAGSPRPVAVIVECLDKSGNLALHLPCTDDHRILGRNWRIAMDTIELVRRRRAPVDTVHMIAAPDRTILIAGYSHYKFTCIMDLGRRAIVRIDETSPTDAHDVSAGCPDLGN